MKVLYLHYKRDLLPTVVIIVMLFFLLFAIGSEEALMALNQLVANPIYQGNGEEPKVAFECNVVWGTEYVPLLLDIFKEYDIRITFFVGGDWAQKNPELLLRMVEEGHEIGNHGYHHKHHSKLDLNGNRKEISETEAVIYQITGIKTTLFAPPYGEFNKTTLQAAESLGYKTIMWSVDTIDWRGDGVDKITSRVLTKIHNGAFVLMHPTSDTVKALPKIIEELTKRGYSIGTVSDLLK